MHWSHIKLDKGAKDTDLMLRLKQTWMCNRGQSVYRAVTGSDWIKCFWEYHGIGGPFWERIASGVLTVSNMKLFWNFHVWPRNWGEHIHDCYWVFLGILAQCCIDEMQFTCPIRGQGKLAQNIIPIEAYAGQWGRIIIKYGKSPIVFMRQQSLFRWSGVPVRQMRERSIF